MNINWPLLLVMIVITASIASAGNWDEECTDFYSSVCNHLVSEEEEETSPFSVVATKHAQTIHQLVGSMPETRYAYQSCLEDEETIAFDPSLTARDLISQGLAHPLHIDVAPALHEPNVYALDISLSSSLYMLYFNSLRIGSQQQPYHPQHWMHTFYSGHIFQKWMRKAANDLEQKEEDRNHIQEEEDDLFETNREMLLWHYVSGYEQWDTFRTRLSRRSALLLEDAFEGALQASTWIHTNGMPATVVDAALLATMQPGVAAELASWTISLLERQSLETAAFSFSSGSMIKQDAIPAMLHQHWHWPHPQHHHHHNHRKQQQLLQNRLSRMTTRLPSTEKEVLLKMRQKGKQKINQEGEDSRRRMICLRMIRLAYTSPINQAFLLHHRQQFPDKEDLIQSIVRRIRESVAEIMHETSWLQEGTRNAALQKLGNMAIYILGAPTNSVNKDQNMVAKMNAFADAGVGYREAIFQWLARDWHRVTQKLVTMPDRWSLDAHLEHEVLYETVNAWYDPTRNTITIPPGILAPPFYEGRLSHDIATLGMVLGHEMGHALDVHGRFFDAHGRFLLTSTLDESFLEQTSILLGWWQLQDLVALRDHMACLAKEMGSPCGRDDYGRHTMGEDMADQMGIRAAYRLVASLALYQHEDDDELGWNDGMASRAFFQLYSQMWCARLTEERECALVEHDVHALPRHRVNTVLRQFPSFKAAFDCTEDAPMTNPTPCTIY